MSRRRWRFPAQVPQRASLVQGEVIGLVALDLVVRIIRAGMMNIAAADHIAGVHPDDAAADPAGLRIPADVIADLERSGAR